MPQKKYTKKESPLTLFQLVGFFDQHIEPRFTQMVSEIAAVREDVAELNARQEDLYKKFEDLQTEYHVICEQLNRMEEKLNRVDAKLDLEIQERRIIGEELPKLKQQATLLQNRIEELERRQAAQH